MHAHTHARMRARLHLGTHAPTHPCTHGAQVIGMCEADLNAKKKTQETETRTVDLLGPQGTKQGSLTFKIEHVRGTCQSMADGSTEAWEARQGGAEQGRTGRDRAGRGRAGRS